MDDESFGRRFGGVARLYGDDAAQRFAGARVCVAGLGGVGSWAAEALARNAVGQLTLIDLDAVGESNTNRQLHALDGNYGQAKVAAMAERIALINPRCQLSVVEDLVTQANLDQLLAGHDVVIDATDDVGMKIAMAVWSRDQSLPLVICGGAGGKINPAMIAMDDFSRTEQDPLLAKVRARLRKEFRFPRDPRRRFGMTAIFSREPVQRPTLCAGDAPQRLSCAGYGSAVVVTATFGMFAAAAALSQLASPAAVAISAD